METIHKTKKASAAFGAADFFSGMEFKSAAPQVSLKQMAKERRAEKLGAAFSRVPDPRALVLGKVQQAGMQVVGQ